MEFIWPQWHAPTSIRALSTTRIGGISQAPYASFNLGDHVGDELNHVQKNRKSLRTQLPSEPVWLKQVHGIAVSTPLSRSLTSDGGIEADAIVSNLPSEVLAILTADCLPVLFAAKDGSVVGAAHAGWRGLCSGVLENTVKEMLLLGKDLVASDLCAWLGPAIGPDAFEVGDDVYQAFTNSGIQIEASDFVPIPDRPGKYHANLYSLAAARLRAIGLMQIDGGQMCTFHDNQHFFSYRRDGVTGRSATLIWISE
jgi:YfiH family protein